MERQGPTIPHALRALAGETSLGFTFEGTGGSRVLTFAEMAADSASRARHLAAAGLTRGDAVALIIPEPADFVLAFLGAMIGGIVPVPMYPPLGANKLHAYLEIATHILRTSGARAIVTSPALAAALEAFTSRLPGLRVITTDVLSQEMPGDAPDPDRIRAGDLAFLQFTSGSVDAPKGVRVTHANIAANCGAIAESLGVSDRDVGVSWLPLFHDMGLVGFVLTPVLYRIPVALIPTLDFVRRPAMWLHAVHRHRGTITFAPNFAFALVSRQRPSEDLDLSCLRVVGCGAEPIHPGTVRRFVETYAPTGLRAEAMLPCYGMAEATLAISFNALREPMMTDVVDAAAYASTGRAIPAAPGAIGETREFVSCGRVISGHRVSVVDEAGRPLPERAVGEIVFSGPSVAAGYHRNPEASSAAFTPEGLKTGDLGYLAGGSLFVTGRKKDLLILNGRNYDPQVVERTSEEVPGVRHGAVVAFTRPGADSEELVVAAEIKSPDADAVAEEIRRRVYDQLQLSVADVVIVAGGSLPKTSSGKLQRSKARDQYLSKGMVCRS